MEGERPAAYVVILGDTELSNSFAVDEGIMAQSMMLGAVDAGFGGCMLGSVNRPQLRELLAIPERYEILLVLALGEPVETVVIDPVGEDGSINTGVTNSRSTVPKRSVDELILE